MKTLFEAMARHRPEWLAQGLFMRAVETHPGVRVILLKKLKWNRLRNEVPIVTEEESTSGGWRADVCVQWGPKKAKVELKLLAQFTDRQREALRRGEIDLVVLPRRSSHELPDHHS